VIRYACGLIPHTGQLMAKFGHKSAIVRSALLTGLGLLLSLGLNMPLAAQVLPPHQDIESIREIVQKFLHSETLKIGKPGTIKVSHLDPQIRLSRCSKAPEVFFLNRNNKIGNLSVGVRCKGNRTWTIYVPARVGVLTKVAVVSRALPRGHLISANDIQKETRDLGILTEGYFLNPRDAIGKSLNRRMVLGAVITPASIKPASAVRRGEKVTILAQRKGVEVRMPGTALANGTAGVMIKVRNNLTNKVVQGVVTKHGEVRVKI
jgi:flagella basal body P-ring formation protein FlgA